MLLTGGGLAVAAVIAGAVALIAPGSDGPQVPTTASDNDAADAAGGDTATAIDVTRPSQAQPVTHAPRSEPAATGLPGGGDPTATAVTVPDPPRQNEQDDSATRTDAPDSGGPSPSQPPTSRPPADRPSTSQPPTSPPPPDDGGPLSRMLRPILD